MRLFFTICLGGGLVLLGISSFRRPAPLGLPAVENQKVVRQAEMIRTSGPALQGAAPRKYLQEPGEGQSLMQAINAARFGLKRQDRGPFGEAGSGYLGMSHDQNLNAWFAEDGVTVHPTVGPKERAHAWHMQMRLKAYGYGNDLVAAAPIVSQHVKDNRIEYERGNFELRNANFESMKSDLSSRGFTGKMPVPLFISQSAIRNPQLIEWYENRAEGIEQGFTIGARPEFNSAGRPDEPLRLVVSLTGDLRAKVKDEGRSIALTDGRGKPALSYDHLTAVDADGKQLSAHMETSAGGRELVLIVDDHEASYPITIDPIVASLEQILDEPGLPQTGSQFGDAVAIDGFLAIVGEWLEDLNGAVDTGAVYGFSRVGSKWTFVAGTSPAHQSQARCGYSVAISADRGVFGCPGALNNAGKAFLLDMNSQVATELIEPDRTAGDFFGASVAIDFNNVVVGAPFATIINRIVTSHDGAIHYFQNNNYRYSYSQFTANQQFGATVVLDGETVLAGAPVANSGTGKVIALTLDQNSFVLRATLTADDAAVGDQFGTGVAISGKTGVIAAPGDDDKGTDAGAAYVFVCDPDGVWSQQQKLTASDGRADDIFSYFAVAIEGNTIVVGARRQDLSSPPVPNDNSGAAYVFTRNGTTWTQQTKLSAGGFYRAPGDEFGTSVGISGNTVIVSAPHEAATDGTANAGVTYVFRLACTPPSVDSAIIIGGGAVGFVSATICPSASIEIAASSPNSDPTVTYQWRKDGADIPGATGSYYSINNLSANDAGGYTVFARNGCGGNISNPATLRVHSFNLSANQNVSASGSPGLISVTCTGACNFTAVSNSPFITITSGATGTAPGTVGFTVAANTGPNQRTGTVTIGDKTFTVTQDAAAPGPTPTPTPTPSPNVIQFSASNYSVQEDCTTVTINVNRIGDTSGAASVDYNTSDATATERKDYIAARGTLRFAAGETSKSFAVLINEDSFVEGNETFSISLSNPSGVTLGGSAITTVTITDDPAETAANPIDDAQNYVCQHYHDFLNRQPDSPGLAFWTNQITACGTDQACIETRRINVSASFFLSIEFQDTGYLVERIYKAAYGDAAGASTFPSAHQLPVPVVRLNEFLSDTQEIGQGVIVGQGNWQQQIENNKQAFTASFVQRSRFTSAFPLSLTAAQFVDLLNANAGNPLSSSERNQLVTDLSTSAKTRAQVLRAVAEDTDLNTAESNRAFVLMQYFGYLRRNPNDPQDSDHTGYDFWLTKLNQFNGNYINAEMVKAFITSIEYRQRFGP